MSTPFIDRPRHRAIRRATEADQVALQALVRGERLNPNGIHWPNFVVAVDAHGIAGAAQLRPHGGALLELGSLVVRRDARGRGLAARLIATLLASHSGEVWMVTAARHAAHYQRWGFTPVPSLAAPFPILRNYLLGQALGGLNAWRHGRAPRRLAVLMRGATSSARPVPS